MTSFLASVANIHETEIALANNVDIIDLKNPRNGALGAVDLPVLKEAVVYIAGRSRISTTIGDLPVQPQVVHRAVSERFEAGTDYVKIGLFPGGDLTGTLVALNREIRLGHALVAVLFADLDPQLYLLPMLADSGFAGVMLDTATKQSGGLSDHVSLVFLSEFVRRSRGLGLFCGLAGSLRQEDVPRLLPLNPDYLGFRGALCREGRTSTIDKTLTREMSALIKGARPDRRPTERPGQPSMPNSFLHDIG